MNARNLLQLCHGPVDGSAPADLRSQKSGPRIDRGLQTDRGPRGQAQGSRRPSPQVASLRPPDSTGRTSMASQRAGAGGAAMLMSHCANCLRADGATQVQAGGQSGSPLPPHPRRRSRLAHPTVIVQHEARLLISAVVAPPEYSQCSRPASEHRPRRG